MGIVHQLLRLRLLHAGHVDLHVHPDPEALRAAGHRPKACTALPKAGVKRSVTTELPLSASGFGKGCSAKTAAIAPARREA